ARRVVDPAGHPAGPRMPVELQPLRTAPEAERERLERVLGRDARRAAVREQARTRTVAVARALLRAATDVRERDGERMRGRGERGQLPPDGALHAIERRANGDGELHRRSRGERHRVDVLAVPVDREMEVRTRREPGRADVADDLAPLDRRTGPAPASERGGRAAGGGQAPG